MRLSAGALALAAALLAPAALAWPYGGSPEAWLDGTQPWDTTPFNEQDIQVSGRGGDGRPALGLGVQAGLLDSLQAEGTWWRSLNGLNDAADLRLQLREPVHPDRWPALALYGDAPWDGRAWSGRGGVIAQVEPWDGCATLNADWGGGGPWRLRAGLWTPYVLSMLRLGGEALVDGGRFSAWTPQLALNAPGDISLLLGLRVDALSGSGPVWIARLSYEWFPNP